MAAGARGPRFRCEACAGPLATAIPTLCPPCAEAFALARRTGLAAAVAEEPAVDVVAEELDLWDAWSLLGDVGSHSGLSRRD